VEPAKAGGGHERLCVASELPLPPAAPLGAPACHRPTPEIAASVTAEVVALFHPTAVGGVAAVAMPCDGLGADVHEIVIEDGSRNGGLHLWRATARGDGKFDVRGVLYDGMASVGMPPIRTTHAVVAIAPADLAAARAALAATVTETVPPVPPNTTRSGITWTSSVDLRLVVRLVDGEHRAIERRFTGYLGSDHQLEYVGLHAAWTHLAAIAKLIASNDPADEGDRALVAERFVAEVPYFDEAYERWVMERDVELAQAFGGPSAIPGLVSRLTLPADPSQANLDTRVTAIDALARITGWDARTPDRPIEDVAADYISACR
jgi:hypothetical protein